MSNLTEIEQRALVAIEKTSNPQRLRNMIENARRIGAERVLRSAFARLCEVQPMAQPGTVQHDVWRSIHALEEILHEERDKTVRLSRTRQKIARDGETKTVTDLTMKPQPSKGFRDLVVRGHPELTFESVVLRHPHVFDDRTKAAARSRLAQAGVDPDQFIASQ